MDGYLSRDPAHLAKLQRQRRARLVRMDYMPGELAQAVIASKREQCRPGSAAATNSAVLDAIVAEWADLTGIKYRPIESPMSSGPRPELSDTKCAHAYEFGGEPRHSAGKVPASAGRCGAKRHRDGQPCEARPEPGKARCRFHGGRSTGPRTIEGRSRSIANLKQNQREKRDDRS